MEKGETGPVSWNRGGLPLPRGVALLTPCTQPKATRAWRSIPLVPIGETPAFEIRLEPLKKGWQLFALFHLTVRTRGLRTLLFDWNRARYLHEGGIPTESISPGATGEKEIFRAHLAHL